LLNYLNETNHLFDSYFELSNQSSYINSCSAFFYQLDNGDLLTWESQTYSFMLRLNGNIIAIFVPIDDSNQGINITNLNIDEFTSIILPIDSDSGIVNYISNGITQSFNYVKGQFKCDVKSLCYSNPFLDQD